MIHVYRCKRGWGVAIAERLVELGAAVAMFDRTEDVPDGARVVFVPRHHQRERAKHKTMIERLAARGCTLSPSLTDSRLYNDKLAQYGALGGFLPATHVLHSAEDADALLSSGALKFPLFSKSSQGAGSHNVRYLERPDQARREISKAFSADGLKLRFGDVQRGYVYWQEAVPTGHDYRVICLGRTYYFAKRRENRRDEPTASGSGVNSPINSGDNPMPDGLLAFAESVCLAGDLTWAGLDIVPMPDGRWRLLETTVAWGTQLNGAAVFDSRWGWQEECFTGDQFFLLAAMMILEGKA